MFFSLFLYFLPRIQWDGEGRVRTLFSLLHFFSFRSYCTYCMYCMYDISICPIIVATTSLLEISVMGRIVALLDTYLHTVHTVCTHSVSIPSCKFTRAKFPRSRFEVNGQVSSMPCPAMQCPALVWISSCLPLLHSLLDANLAEIEYIHNTIYS